MPPSTSCTRSGSPADSLISATGWLMPLGFCSLPGCSIGYTEKPKPFNKRCQTHRKDKMRPIVLFFLLLISLAVGLQAQSFSAFSQPRFFAGGSGGLFRISLDDFTSIYTSRWGVSPGGAAGVRVYKNNYLVGKYRTFNKNGKPSGIAPHSGLSLSQADWHEQWIAVGVRIQPPLESRGNSYYGFGAVFYRVEEDENLSLFDMQNEENRNTGSGFYLELGLQYFLHPRTAGFFEMEIASGGIRGRTGFEGFSVGGFRFALGLLIFLF